MPQLELGRALLQTTTVTVMVILGIPLYRTERPKIMAISLCYRKRQSSTMPARILIYPKM
jgi:hypothetical protein